jgi:cytochrome oxidase Cu insertion factor (SCO1/SenC/PrrC family)
MQRLSRVAPAVLVLGIALAGCSPGAPVSVRSTKASPPSLEIVGSDQDGVTFKLSDYRGKVVLLDFWGNW